MIDRVRRTGLPEEIAGQIQSFITSSRFRPGDRLPSTVRLAEMLGVGVPTLREAINQLKAVDVLEVRHGSGVYVGQAVDRLFVESPAPGPLTRQRVLDMLETRLLIDPPAAGMAAERASKSDLENIAKLLDEEQLDVENPAANYPSNFHLDVALAAGNMVLADLSRVLLQQFRREHLRILHVVRSAAEDVRQHREIFAAIEARDREAAIELSTNHLNQIRDGVARSRKVAAVLKELGVE